MEDKRNNNESEKEQALFAKLELSYAKSKAQVWEEISGKITDKPVKAKVVKLFPSWAQWSAAASIAVMLGLGLFARYYTTAITLAAGEFKEHTLPDGSVVHLNASSSLSYAPYWWSFEREVKMEGEAFFEVAKGQRFAVYSTLGTTEVLGTQFNIYARKGDYQVYCKTGKVKVTAKVGDAMLSPGEYASLEEGKLVKQINPPKPEEVLSWRMSKFLYNTTPLLKVIEDLQRHYNVKISLSVGSIASLHYTGLFNREVNIEEALEIICYSFGWKFEEVQANMYVIK